MLGEKKETRQSSATEDSYLKDAAQKKMQCKGLMEFLIERRIKLSKDGELTLNKP